MPEPKAPECLFCKIAKGEIPAKIIYDSKDIMAFLDIRPANPGHVLIIPKQHYTFLPQLPSELNASILELIKVIISAQVEVLGAEGVNVLQNNGQAAGQMVPHIHFHLIPRFKGDKVILNWQPMELKEEQFIEIQKRLIEGSKRAYESTQTGVPEQAQQTQAFAPQKQEEKTQTPPPKQKPIKLKPKHA